MDSVAPVEATVEATVEPAVEATVEATSNKDTITITSPKIAFKIAQQCDTFERDVTLEDIAAATGGAQVDDETSEDQDRDVDILLDLQKAITGTTNTKRVLLDRREDEETDDEEAEEGEDSDEDDDDDDDDDEEEEFYINSAKRCAVLQRMLTERDERIATLNDAALESIALRVRVEELRATNERLWALVDALVTGSARRRS